jgi:hypothetical protein
MKKEKQIQISESTFVELYKLIIALKNYELDRNITERVQSLETAIESKFESMTRRQAFTEYKTAAPTTEDRESKRQKYLELAGLHSDWRSKKETFH